MAELDTGTLIAAATGLAGAVVAFSRWLAGVWRDLRREEIAGRKEEAEKQRDMRREEIAASKYAAELQRDAQSRMIDALNANAREMATLTSNLHEFHRRLDDLFERTPIPRGVDFDHPQAHATTHAGAGPGPRAVTGREDSGVVGTRVGSYRSPRRGYPDE